MLTPTIGDATLYRAALASPHQVYTRVDVVDPNGVVLVSDLPYATGQVQATLQQRVTRTLDIAVDRSWLPATRVGVPDWTAPLAPAGNRLRAYRGIVMGDGTVISFPVFHGRIETVSYTGGGTVAINAQDLAAEVIDAEFEGPSNSVTTNTPVAEFQRIVTLGLPNAVFGTGDTYGTLTVPSLTYTTDRGKALDDLANAVGSYWYTLADGSFVLRRIPWTTTRTQVTTLNDGVGGTVVTFTLAMSRTGVKNSVVYSSERQDGTAPITVISRDMDTTSPTYYLGKFGRKAVSVVNQQNQQQGQVSAAADAQLRSVKSLNATWTLGIVPDPSLELGDLVGVTGDDSVDQPYTALTGQQVISGYTLPLREDASMTVRMRAYTPGSLS